MRRRYRRPPERRQHRKVVALKREAKMLEDALWLLRGDGFMKASEAPADCLRIPDESVSFYRETRTMRTDQFIELECSVQVFLDKATMARIAERPERVAFRGILWVMTSVEAFVQRGPSAMVGPRAVTINLVAIAGAHRG